MIAAAIIENPQAGQIAVQTMRATIINAIVVNRIASFILK